MASTVISSRPRIHYIPAEVSFVEAMVDGLLALQDKEEVSLPSMTVLLPNRRACRTLQDAFASRLRDGGTAASLLPRLQPIGEPDDDDLMVLGPAILGEAQNIPPAIGPLRRRLMLARMILARGPIGGEAPRLDQAIQLADALSRLVDEIETNGLSLDALDGLVVGELAEHWQITLDFFDLLRRQWPRVLEAEGAIDPSLRRNQLLDLQARLWQASPPDGFVIAAGSTGSIPATARLMSAIAALPRGVIVLPGLDMVPNPDDWQAIEADPSHPQFGLAQLLQRLGVTREEVTVWPGVAVDFKPHARAWFVSTALLPAERTDKWPELRRSPLPMSTKLEGLERIDCRSEQEEALVIAIALRQFLFENATGSAALVTPDRALAQRVAGELRRWEIDIDDSAGKPLSRCPSGVFLLALAKAAAQQWSPVALLSLLKHPISACGMPAGAIGAVAALLEIEILRGPRPASGWEGLIAALAAKHSESSADDRELLVHAIARLRTATEALVDWPRELSPLSRIASLINAAEALAASELESGPDRLYRGEDGEALSQFLSEALQAFSGLPGCDPMTFETMLSDLLAGIDVRARFGRHPRLFIWGPLEARLQQADLLVLGGLNEGTWPAEGGDDPWMSRPMRRQFGLPALERRIGLAAHDFQQALGAKRVLLTRSLRVEGAPSVPSRWLLRLNALSACIETPAVRIAEELRDLALAIDDAGPPTPCLRPTPSPGSAWMPRSLSVTRIEMWRRDPYAIYASKILRLQKLDPLDQDPSTADLGIIIHHALDRFVSADRNQGQKNGLDLLLEIGRECFGELLHRPNVWAFWWPRFERIAAWFIERENERRPFILRSLTEAEATTRIEHGAHHLDLHAKADRLDLMRDNSLAIIDYKTGGIPDGTEVRLGFSPQLALEAMLALKRAFADLPTHVKIQEIAYWRLKGGDIGGEIHRPRFERHDLDPHQLAIEAEQGLHRLLDYHATKDAYYPAVPDLRFAPRYSDYAHLERLLEWSAGGEVE